MLELYRDDDGDPVQALSLRFGTFVNNGLVEFTGDFPGVALDLPPSNPRIARAGMARNLQTTPRWLRDIADSQKLSVWAAAQARELAPFTFLHALADKTGLPSWDSHGTCVNASGTIGLYFGASIGGGVCTVTDSAGNEGVAITLAGSIALSPSSSPQIGADVAVDIGSVAGAGKDVGRTTSIFDLGGPSWCWNASLEVVIGVTASHCWSPDAGTTQIGPHTFDLADSTFARGGIHSVYAGVAFGAGVSLSGTASYTIVVECGVWQAYYHGECPHPPKIDSISPSSGPIAGGGTMTILGHHLNRDSMSVIFVDPGTGSGQFPTANATILERSDTRLVVRIPRSPSGRASSVKVVVSTPAGDSEFASDPLRRSYTYVG